MRRCARPTASEALGAAAADPASVALAPPCAWKTSRSCCARSRRSPRRSVIRTGSSPSPRRGAPSASPRSPSSPGAGHSSWPRRPVPTPASCTTTCASTCPTARSSCSRRGRPCRSSGSARAWRRWAAGSRSSGGCALPSGPRRSSSPASAPCCSASARGPPRSTRSACVRATCSTPTPCCAASWSSATAASSSSSTAARWRCAARSSTSTRPRPTPRSASTCGATRSTG